MQSLKDFLENQEQKTRETYKGILPKETIDDTIEGERKRFKALAEVICGMMEEIVPKVNRNNKKFDNSLNELMPINDLIYLISEIKKAFL